MLKALRSIAIWSATLALIVCWVPVVALIRLFDRDPLKIRTARSFRRLGPIVASVHPWRLRISGLENIAANQAYVIVSNHQSLTDIPLVAHVKIDTKWLAKAELFQLPALGWMLRMSADIPVERTDRRKAAQALLRCARALRQRCSVIFFPEGTRSPDGEILPFNDGPFQLAIRERVPVLPLVLEGSGAALPRDGWMFGNKCDIHLRVLEAVPVDAWNAKQAGELRDVVRERMIAELHRLRGV